MKEHELKFQQKYLENFKKFKILNDSFNEKILKPQNDEKELKQEIEQRVSFFLETHPPVGFDFLELEYFDSNIVASFIEVATNHNLKYDCREEKKLILSDIINESVVFSLIAQFIDIRKIINNLYFEFNKEVRVLYDEISPSLCEINEKYLFINFLSQEKCIIETQTTTPAFDGAVAEVVRNIFLFDVNYCSVIK